MINFPIPRLDKNQKLRNILLQFCRLKKNDIWIDPQGIHKIGCIDVADSDKLQQFFGKEKAELAIHDPPYNFVAFDLRTPGQFVEWCEKWIGNTFIHQPENAALYVWIGADQKKHFEPFPEFTLMMRSSGYKSRSFITMRNQRGYGTQKNWMAVRQELLYYAKGEPEFNASSVYTEIPKILRGYYKEINGKLTENFERSKSENIRAGNVWIDVQQVFHLLEENVNGCYAQKPLKAIERIIEVSSSKADLIFDGFAHSGATLIAAEQLKRRCFTVDIDPVYCEIAIRRLEHFRDTGKTGWQNSNPFAEELQNKENLKELLNS